MLSPDLLNHRQTPPPPSGGSAHESRELYRVMQRGDGEMQVELTDEGMLRKLQETLSPQPRAARRTGGDEPQHLYFVAQDRGDGTFGVTLTEDGVKRFETALGIAEDLGRHTTISKHSTIADIMERTATRDELSEVLRRGGDGLLHRAHRAILRRKLRGTEQPAADHRTISHIGKACIVGIIALWSLQQFGVAIQDIQNIPGILANFPNDLLNLAPTRAFDAVGSTIDDAGQHVLIGLLGAIATYIAAKVIKPFARIYRKDQLVPGERLAVRCLTWALNTSPLRR